MNVNEHLGCQLPEERGEKEVVKNLQRSEERKKKIQTSHMIERRKTSMALARHRDYGTCTKTSTIASSSSVKRR